MTTINQLQAELAALKSRDIDIKDLYVLSILNELSEFSDGEYTLEEEVDMAYDGDSGECIEIVASIRERLHTVREMLEGGEAKSAYYAEGYDAARNHEPNINRYLESSRLGQEWQAGYDQAMEDMYHETMSDLDSDI